MHANQKHIPSTGNKEQHLILFISSKTKMLANFSHMNDKDDV